MRFAWLLALIILVLISAAVFMKDRVDSSSAVTTQPSSSAIPLSSTTQPPSSAVSPSSKKQTSSSAIPKKQPSSSAIPKGKPVSLSAGNSAAYKEYEREMRQLMKQIGPNNQGEFEKLKLTMQAEGDMELLRKLCEKVVDQGLKGDVYETGCWRGGTGIWMALVFNKYERLKGINSTRNFYFFDSFEGFPDVKEDATLSKHLSKPLYAVPVEEVKKTFQRFGVLNERTHFVKGYFEETVPKLIVSRPISLLRMDGDLYSSTQVVLDNLYEHVERGGWCIADDYTWDPPRQNPKTKLCKAAVDEYRKAHGITARIQQVCGRPCWQNTGGKGQK